MNAHEALPKQRFELTEEQRTILVSALLIAVEQYRKDAEATGRDGLAGYQAQFTYQADDVQALADRLENADTIVIGAEVE